MLSNILPEFRRYKNEAVFYIGLVATVVMELAILVSDTDINSLEALIALVPGVLGLFQRRSAWGPETHSEEVAAAIARARTQS